MLSPEKLGVIIIVALAMLCFVIDRWLLKSWVERQLDEGERKRRTADADKQEVRQMINANAALIERVNALLRRVK